MQKKKVVVVLLAFAPVFLSSARTVQSQETIASEAVLAGVRQAAPEEFTVEFEVSRPVHILPGQGDETRTIRVALDHDVIAIVWTSQLPDPKYFPFGTRGYQAPDYDQDANLILAMEKSGGIVWDTRTNEECSEVVTYRITPAGGIQSESTNFTLTRNAPGNSNIVSLNLLRRALWALGRPLPNDVAASISSRARSGHVVGARAPWGGVAGLEVEPDHGYVVRKASFGADGVPPRAECQSEGIRLFGDTAFADHGTFRIDTETISAKLTSFQRGADAGIIAEARRLVSEARKHSILLIDSREDEGRPKARLVPAGDLDK